jgi:hypothetical protein
MSNAAETKKRCAALSAFVRILYFRILQILLILSGLMQERYIRWYLSRDFEMLVFGGGSGLPLILFPTSFGALSSK